MKKIAKLLFEAKILKEIPRSGYHFLGAGRESVAEHTFSTTFIAYVMTELLPDVDALKLISMCLIHDFPEARTGDLNTVHKKYVTADEKKALKDATAGLFFGGKKLSLMYGVHRYSHLIMSLCSRRHLSIIGLRGSRPAF